MADVEGRGSISSDINNNGNMSSGSSSSSNPLPLMSRGTAVSALPLSRGTVDEWLAMAVTRS